MERIASWASFGGRVDRYQHRSEVLDCDMVFGAFLPPQAQDGPVPALWWLSGLTCTDENFMQKAGAQRLAAGQVDGEASSVRPRWPMDQLEPIEAA